jgi:hypothetical protein
MAANKVGGNKRVILNRKSRLREKAHETRNKRNVPGIRKFFKWKYLKPEANEKEDLVPGK